MEYAELSEATIMMVLPKRATVPLNTTLDMDFVRAAFPALQSDWCFFDNAGGSQILQSVIDRMQTYLVTTNVQLGASYGVSQKATERLQAANQFAATLVNAADVSEVIMGPSTSMLLRVLAHCVGKTLVPGDEIVITNCDHEANITPWLELQQQGIVIRTWSMNPDSLTLELADLEPLLTPRTRLVTVVHASNVLGQLHPIRAIADRVHQAGSLLCVDGVGYAPHRLVDVQAMDVDFYAFSFYKVYGPHHAMLYGKRDLLLGLPNFNHEFIAPEQTPYKFQPGGANYELSYSILGIKDYLMTLSRHHGREYHSLRQELIHGFELISHHEAELSERFLDFLNSHPRVRVIGPTSADAEVRVPIIAFTVDGLNSATIPPLVDPHKIGIRYGDFYARRLIHDLGLADQGGVVRVSMVHYNTIAECDRLIHILEGILS
jgi:cysteine desulfurase family protein (TIGR01976 family)